MFSFQAKKEKNGEKTIQTNGASEDIFGDEHEDNEKLMALAMSFEAKYVSTPRYSNVNLMFWTIF